MLHLHSCRTLMRGALVLIGLQAALQASVIPLHQGNNNPIHEGFTEVNYNFAIGLFDDGGFPSWHISPGTTVGQFYYRTLTDDQKSEAFTEGWVLEGGFRLPEAVEGYGGFLDLDFGTRRYDMNLLVQDGALFLRANTYVNGAVDGIMLAVSGGLSDYHAFRMVGLGGSTSASLWIDGVLRLTGYQGHTTSLTDRGVWFGAVGQDVNFTDISFSTPTPEPASMIFVGAGLIAAAALRRRLSR